MIFFRTLLANLPDRGERLRGKRNEVAKALEEVREREWNLRTAYLPVDVQALGLYNFTNRSYRKRIYCYRYILFKL